MEIMVFVTMLGAIFAGHYAQRCFHTLRQVRDKLDAIGGVAALSPSKK